jgi:hypothetical protein
MASRCSLRTVVSGVIQAGEMKLIDGEEQRQI